MKWYVKLNVQCTQLLDYNVSLNLYQPLITYNIALQFFSVTYKAQIYMYMHTYISAYMHIY